MLQRGSLVQSRPFDFCFTVSLCPVNVRKPGCGINPTSCDTRESPPCIWGGSLWEAFFVVSQKWSLPTVRKGQSICLMDLLTHETSHRAACPTRWLEALHKAAPAPDMNTIGRSKWRASEACSFKINKPPPQKKTTKEKCPLPHWPLQAQAKQETPQEIEVQLLQVDSLDHCA